MILGRGGWAVAAHQGAPCEPTERERAGDLDRKRTGGSLHRYRRRRHRRRVMWWTGHGACIETPWLWTGERAFCPGASYIQLTTCCRSPSRVSLSANHERSGHPSLSFLLAPPPHNLISLFLVFRCRPESSGNARARA